MINLKNEETKERETYALFKKVSCLCVSVSVCVKAREKAKLIGETNCTAQNMKNNDKLKVVN